MNLAYNISEHLTGYLDKIDRLRTEILLFPVSAKNEIRLKWDANLERIIWTLSLTDNPLSKKQIENLLTIFIAPKRKLAKDEKDVVSLKNAFSYIKENWLVNPNPVSITTIKKLYDISCKPIWGSASGLTEYSEKRMNALFDYLAKGADHPFIQAGLAQAEIINITPFDNGNGRIARLVSYIYLYKNGWDIRMLLNLEEFYKRDIVTYKRMLDLSKVQGNTTVWLEYFTFTAASALEKAFELVKNLKFQDDIPASFWKLNGRQKEIIEKLENPNLKITNKEVQKMYHVSQITASRDLARLTNMGLLLAHGNGRSVYYTKA